MATYNPTSRRCSLCGQYQITEDRELLLADERFEWDESLVEDFIAGNRHQCFDTDPFGARESERLVEEGLVVPELRWLLELALERKQAAGRPAWAIFTGPAASSATAPMGTTPCRRPVRAAVSAAEGRALVLLPGGGQGPSLAVHARTAPCDDPPSPRRAYAQHH